MRDFEHVFNVLNKVILEEMPFHIAIKSSLKADKKDRDASFKQSISSLSGCVLRHYYVFEELINRKYPEIEKKNFILLSMGLANHLFAKRYDEDKLISFIVSESGIKDAKEFILSFEDPKNIIPEDIEPESRKYFSLRYNLPLWVVKMWERNCGPILSKKLYYSFSKSKHTLLRVNKELVVAKHLLEDYPELSENENDNFVYYHGTGNYKTLQCFKNKEILPIPAGYNFLLSKLEIDSFRGIAIYSACNNSLINELVQQLGSDFKVDYMCGSQKHFFEMRQKKNELKTSNLSLYEIQSEGMKTCVSKPVHYMFVCPSNSNFNELRDKPDYFLRCKQEQLDTFIQEEKKALLAATELVEDGGNIIYFVPTVCRNETRSIINAFLNEHKGYTLVEEKQLFPFDKYQSMLYFAILRKEDQHD